MAEQGGAGSMLGPLEAEVMAVLWRAGAPLPVREVAADARAGLAVLRIAYSDGDQGVLVVSCDQPGTPTNLPIFEGITVTKGFVDYWNRVAPESVPPFGNRTTFHVLR